MSLMEIILVVVVAVAVVVLVSGALLLWRHQQLRRRFGPEYNRLAKESGPLAADRELRGRERRHASLELRDLDDQARARYSAAWVEVQTRFVDTPEQAIGEADELLARLIAERGYPMRDQDEQLAQLSVDHARTLEHYRAARAIHERHERGEASTEELRQAFVHYRALFADLLGQDPVQASEREESVREESVRSGNRERTVR